MPFLLLALRKHFTCVYLSYITHSVFMYNIHSEWDAPSVSYIHLACTHAHVQCSLKEFRKLPLVGIVVPHTSHNKKINLPLWMPIYIEGIKKVPNEAEMPLCSARGHYI